MIENFNRRISRSGLAVRSSPTHKMAKNTSPGGKVVTNKGAGTPGEEANKMTDSTVMCSMQDVWGFLISMQNTITKQSDEIKSLALKNQDLEHKHQMQNSKITMLEEQVQKLQATCDKQVVNLQDAMTIHEEKLTQMHEKTQLNVQKTVGSWAQIARNGSTSSHPTPILHDIQDNEEIKEYNEKEKRKMNIVVRGMAESDNEQVITLNMGVTDMISDKFGMKDVVVYGAHRVGKQKPDAPRTVVCTLLDARKRAIILDNARVYLKNSPLYISEDRTPNQQKARREAYEERTNKSTTPSPDK